MPYNIYFIFFMENIYKMYVQFADMVYQQIVGIPMGKNCAPLIADLFLYCYERDFMSNLQKSKRFDYFWYIIHEIESMILKVASHVEVEKQKSLLINNFSVLNRY